MIERFRELGYPEVGPVPDGAHRPKWSVMIPTFNCAALLRQTLAGVLAQDPGPERMQIEVIDDVSTRDDPEAVVREVAGDRVAFHRHPQNVGATANFNACLAQSRGHLVHILHGDDLVLPGFYARMEELFDRNPEAGSAFCRHVSIDEDGLWTWMPEPRQRSRGIYPEALPAMASYNGTQFAAVVLRRSLVEDVGGFHPSLIHAADWDLWRRAAFHRPMAYDPAVLACYRVFAGNDTARLVRSGANVADIRRAIELADRYLPAGESGPWQRAARRNWAVDASNRARDMLIRGDLEGFLNQSRETCLLDPDFFWSRPHLEMRYWLLKKRLKQRMIQVRNRIMGGRVPAPAAGPEPSGTTP